MKLLEIKHFKCKRCNKEFEYTDESLHNVVFIFIMYHKCE